MPFTLASSSFMVMFRAQWVPIDLSQQKHWPLDDNFLILAVGEFWRQNFILQLGSDILQRVVM
jgi:hypothetical protein